MQGVCVKCKESVKCKENVKRKVKSDSKSGQLRFVLLSILPGKRGNSRAPCRLIRPLDLARPKRAGAFDDIEVTDDLRMASQEMRSCLNGPSSMRT